MTAPHSVRAVPLLVLVLVLVLVLAILPGFSQSRVVVSGGGARSKTVTIQVSWWPVGIASQRGAMPVLLPGHQAWGTDRPVVSPPLSP